MDVKPLFWQTHCWAQFITIMEIKTKFNVNDEVWFVHPTSQRAVQGRIMGMQIRIDGKPKYRRSDDGKRGLIRTGEYEAQRFVHLYSIDDNVRKEGCTKGEYDIYETKEQLVESLKAKADSL